MNKKWQLLQKLSHWTTFVTGPTIYLPTRPPIPATLPNRPVRVPKAPRLLSAWLDTPLTAPPVSAFSKKPILPNEEIALTAPFAAPPKPPATVAVTLVTFPSTPPMKPTALLTDLRPPAKLSPVAPAVLTPTTPPALLMTLPMLLVNSPMELLALPSDEATWITDEDPDPTLLKILLTPLAAMPCNYV